MLHICTMLNCIYLSKHNMHNISGRLINILEYKLIPRSLNHIQHDNKNSIPLSVVNLLARQHIRSQPKTRLNLEQKSSGYQLETTSTKQLWPKGTKHMINITISRHRNMPRSSAFISKKSIHKNLP